MTPEEKHLLERAVALGEENNQILHGIRRTNRWGIAYKVIYWIVVIAISYGAYVYIQPYVDSILNAYKSVMGTVNGVQEVTSKIQNL